MYTVACETDRQHSILRDGVVVGNITRDAIYPYYYTAVLYDTPEQNGRSIRGYQFTKTVKRLLGGEHFQYLV